jgi:fatty-acyl-CoA synthase
VRTTYAVVRERAKRFSNALQALGVGPGDRVAPLAWNTARHMEAWYGIMGIGAVTPSTRACSSTSSATSSTR